MPSAGREPSPYRAYDVNSRPNKTHKSGYYDEEKRRVGHDGRMGGTQPLAEPEDETNEGDPKRHTSTLSVGTACQPVGLAKFPSTAFAAVDRRHFVLRVVVAQELFRHHREDYGDQGEQGTHVEI